MCLLVVGLVTRDGNQPSGAPAPAAKHRDTSQAAANSTPTRPAARKASNTSSAKSKRARASTVEQQPAAYESEEGDGSEPDEDNEVGDKRKRKARPACKPGLDEFTEDEDLVLKHAVKGLRIFLFTVNAFPDDEDVLDLTLHRLAVDAIDEYNLDMDVSDRMITYVRFRCGYDLYL